MERITTTTRVVDLFGPGKDGFGEGPPLATELNAAWFNNVQEELAAVVEGQGIVLDGLDLTQLKQALDDYAFVDPTITGTLTIANGGALLLEAGATLTANVGSTATYDGDLIVGGLGSLTVNGPADFMAGVTLGDLPGDPITINGTTTANAPVFLAAGGLLGSQEIEGGAGSTVDVDRVEVTTLAFDDSALFTNAKGEMRLNDTVLMLGNGNSQTVAIADPRRSFDPTHVTSNAIQATNATVIRRVQPDEPVAAYVMFRWENSAALTTMNFRLEVTGPLGTVILDVDTPAPKAANSREIWASAVTWAPTDSWPVETLTQGYTFNVLIGVSGLNTVTANNIDLRVYSALRVP